MNIAHPGRQFNSIRSDGASAANPGRAAAYGIGVGLDSQADGI